MRATHMSQCVGAKGSGLAMPEAMLLGKPVIGTGYSGNIDFMDKTKSLLVDYKLVPVGKSNPPYDANAHWAESSIERAASLTRRLYENRVWAAQFGVQARSDAQHRVSLENASRRMAEGWRTSIPKSAASNANRRLWLN